MNTNIQVPVLYGTDNTTMYRDLDIPLSIADFKQGVATINLSNIAVVYPSCDGGVWFTSDNGNIFPSITSFDSIHKVVKKLTDLGDLNFVALKFIGLTTHMPIIRQDVETDIEKELDAFNEINEEEWMEGRPSISKRGDAEFKPDSMSENLLYDSDDIDADAQREYTMLVSLDSIVSISPANNKQVLLTILGQKELIPVMVNYDELAKSVIGDILVSDIPKNFR